MAYSTLIRRLVKEFSERRPTRTKSLIVTVFGDIVSPHGGSIWLGSLIRVLAPLGIDERLVRTSVFRLVQQGWLESEQQGRRSFYQFSSYGRQEYQRAARRIYAQQDFGWSGNWLVLIPLDMSDRDKDRFRASLHWQGFRALASGAFAKPEGGRQVLSETLTEFDMIERVLLMRATTDELSSISLTKKVVSEFWHLESLEEEYRRFIRHYKPVMKWAKNESGVAPNEALLARLLLIHDYRRILLQDTDLPADLLPARWSGLQARHLTGQIYRLLADSSCEFICSELESSVGLLPDQDATFQSRFEGLD